VSGNYKPEEKLINAGSCAHGGQRILHLNEIRYSYTRVTDMQVRHNFSARHNQLPANPPVASKCGSYFYGGACHMQTAGFHYGGMRARSDMHRHGFIFYGIMCEAFEPSPCPFWFEDRRLNSL
jgi:hypothetical protein